MSLAEHEFGRLAMEIPARPKVGGVYRRIKPLFDFAVGSVLFILMAPVAVLAMVAVRLTSPGSAIYRQQRLGRDGKIFTIFKIRTMYDGCERLSGRIWSPPGDPRVTRVGRILRSTHLDELPQLVNVLLGEMSVVGPRPERPEFLAGLERAVPDYRRRLAVRPGLTGLAQVQQPPDSNLDSVCRKLQYDLFYVEGMSLSLDFRIILATALKCVGVPFARIGRWLSLPDPNGRVGSVGTQRRSHDRTFPVVHVGRGPAAAISQADRKQLGPPSPPEVGTPPCTVRNGRTASSDLNEHRWEDDPRRSGHRSSRRRR
jgi:lipopolysaccharide/colanic/teichoic acid biosynthesis glycosyltransferase